mgnify:CR=1 FL=1
MEGHPHASLMAEYAEDAKTLRQPWLRWAHRTDNSLRWHKMGEMPLWNTDTRYRRLVKVGNIGGRSVPLPITEGVELPQGKYYVITLSEKGFGKQAYDYKGDIDSETGGIVQSARDRGVLFTCIEDADTFIAEVQALIRSGNAE